MKRILATLLAVTMLIGAGMTSVPVSAAAEEEGYTIAYVGCISASQFYVGMVYGIEDAMTEAGNIELLKTDTYIVHEQLDAINNYISLGIDGMILTPGDPGAISSGIDALNEAGIPVVICDIIPDNKGYVGSYASDNYAIGVQTARELAERLETKYGEVKGSIACMIGSQAITSHYNRWHGFLDTVEAEYPGIEILAQEGQTSAEDALNQATNWFTMFGNSLDAIWDPTDTSAVAATQAAKATNNYYDVGDENHCIIISIDGEPNVVDLIRQNSVDCTVAQNSYQMGIDAANGLLAYLADGTVPEEQDNVVPFMSIDTENCNSDEVAGKCWADIVMARD